MAHLEFFVSLPTLEDGMYIQSNYAPDSPKKGHDICIAFNGMDNSRNIAQV